METSSFLFFEYNIRYVHCSFEIKRRIHKKGSAPHLSNPESFFQFYAQNTLNEKISFRQCGPAIILWVIDYGDNFLDCAKSAIFQNFSKNCFCLAVSPPSLYHRPDGLLVKFMILPHKCFSSSVVKGFVLSPLVFSNFTNQNERIHNHSYSIKNYD